jgi:WD40 repeat protein
MPGAPENYVWDVQLSPDGQRLLTLTSHEIELWDLAQGKKIAVLDNKLASGHPHLAFSPDSKQVIVARWIDGKVKRWNAADGTGLGDWQQVFPVSPRKVVFSPDGKLVALAGEHCNDNNYKKLRLCELATGKIVSLVQLPTQITSFLFAPDGKTLAVGTDTGAVDLWHTDGTLAQAVLPAPQPVVGMSFTGDHKSLVSITTDGQLNVWGLATFAKQKRGQFVLKAQDVPKLVSPDGKFLATVSKEGTLRLWDTANGKLLWTAAAPVVARPLPKQELPFKGPGGQPPVQPEGPESAPTFVLAFAPDGKTLAARTGEETVTVWESDSGELVRTLKTGTVPYCLALSPKGKTLLVGATAHDKAVQLFDVASGKGAGQIPVPAPAPGAGGEKTVEAFIDALQMTPDGTTLLVVERIETTLLNAPIPFGAPNPKFTTYQARLWDLAGKKELALIPHLVTSAAALSPDSNFLAVNRSTAATGLAQDQGLAVWDIKLKKQVGFGHIPSQITGITFSPDAGMLATHGTDPIFHGLDPTILIWDVAELKKLVAGR